MRPAPIPRKNTAARAIFNAMQKSVEENKEVCISGIRDSLGRTISHNTFSPAIGRIKKHHFQGLHFYTRKDPDLNGVTYLGFLVECEDMASEPINNTQQLPDYDEYENLIPMGQ